MTVHVGVLFLTWNPVVHAETYNVIFKTKLEDKGEIYKENLYEPTVEISLKDVRKHKDVFVEVRVYIYDLVSFA